MGLKKEEYEKFLTKSSRGYKLLGHSLIVDEQFESLLQKHGKFCKDCRIPFIPQPFFRENYPQATHYPTKEICGFCIYEMDSQRHSELLYEEEFKEYYDN